MKAIFARLKDLLLSWGPAGLFLATLVDGAGLPNPDGPDILLLLYATAAPERAFVGAAAAVVGSLIGSYIFFRIAQKGGEMLMRKYTEGPRGRKFHQWFKRYGLVTVFVPTLVPFPMPLKAFIVCAAVLGVSPGAFIATTAAGRIPRYFGLAYLGQQLGEHSLEWLKSHTREFGLLALGLVVFLFVLVKVVERFHHVPEQA